MTCPCLQLRQGVSILLANFNKRTVAKAVHRDRWATHGRLYQFSKKKSSAQGFFKDQFRTAQSSNFMASAEREPIRESGGRAPSGSPGGRAPGGGSGGEAPP